MMKYRHAKIIKKYILIIVCAFLFLNLFIYLEKHDRSYTIISNTVNPLSPQSIHVLNKVKDHAVIFEVYTNSESVVAKKVKQFFTPYLHINNSIQLTFIDPTTHPNEVMENAVSVQGEIVLRIDQLNKKINITELSESSIINALITLLNDKDQWIVIGEGYGMAQIDDESAQGLSNLLIYLKKTGYKVARMSLNKSVILPDNVKLIILPSPTEDIGMENAEWLNSQINNGVSFWWLNDVDVSHQSNLELVLDVMSTEKLELENDEYTTYISEFSAHQITENFNQPIFIPQAREIIAESFEPLFINKEKNSFAVTKQLKNSRLVITGDADFIKNQYLDSAANKSMSIRIIDWLLNNEDRVNLPVKINQNTQLLLSQNQLLLISLLLLVLIPIVFLTIAVIQWRKCNARNQR